MRVPAIERAPILQALDSGAEGIQAPLVGSRADAAATVALAKYAPEGSRGLASVRALSYGLVGSMAENVARANERSLVVCQIETVAGLDALDEICAVPGVDVVFVGPTDLGQSLGVVGERDHPDSSRRSTASPRPCSARGRCSGSSSVTRRTLSNGSGGALAISASTSSTCCARAANGSRPRWSRPEGNENVEKG